MDADETEIYNYLSSYNGAWINAKEVCRRAGGKRRFADDPRWARPVLLRLKELRLIEADMAGRYRVKPEDEEETPTIMLEGEEKPDADTELDADQDEQF